MFKINQKYARLAKLQTVKGHLTAIGQEGQYIDSGVTIDDSSAPDTSVLYTSSKIDSLAGEKADLVIPAASGNLATIDALGQYQDGGKKINDAAAPSISVLYTSSKMNGLLAVKADLSVPVAAGNLASINALGQYQDGGVKINDASAPSTSVLYTSSKIDSLAGQKADLVVPAAAGNLAIIDALGQYQDGGYIVDDSAAPAANVLYSSLKIKLFVFGQFNAVAVPIAAGVPLTATAITDPESTWGGTAFTAPRTAVYMASAVVRLLNGQVSADRWCQLEMFIGGQVFIDRKTYGGAAAGVGDQDSVWFQLTFSYKLTAGQTISWAITNALGFSKTVNPTYSKFTISEL